MFPDGLPGGGLLLLRVAAGSVLLTQGVDYFGAKREMGFPALASIAVLSAIGFLLVIGLWTRLAAFVASIAGVSSVLSSMPGLGIGPLVTPTTALLTTVIVVAIICLGPGAFSLDARLFGRREIIIPRSSSQT
jgi:uncharacterized membrane protein YphA (DoxX/SURF4 family)